MLVTVALQYGLAAYASTLPFWAALALGALVGSFIAHALGVAIHECAHDMVFRSSWANKVLSVIVNMPLGAPGAMAFRAEHLLHHYYLGATDGRDHQTPHEDELGPVGHTLSSKLKWLVLGIAKADRVHPRPLPPSLRGWHRLNVATTFGQWPLFLYFAPTAFLYLSVSTIFAFRFSVVCARRYAEHVGLRDGQPTNSYYGPLNWLSFCVGYHVEHHDFPGVPWYRLPALRRIAREHYDPLAQVRSWTGLVFAFLLDRRHGLDRYTSFHGLRRGTAAASESSGSGETPIAPTPGRA